MPRYIAFLRAINVGGHVVKMTTLKDLFTQLSFSGVETFIASGNVIFESKSTTVKALEHRIEKHLESALGYSVATFLRTDQEVRAVSDYRPFSEADLKQAQTLLVGFLRDPLSHGAISAVKSLKTETDNLHVQGREIYWLIRGRLSGSTLSYKAFERVINGPATFRAVNTVARLAAKYPPSLVAKHATPV